MRTPNAVAMVALVAACSGPGGLVPTPGVSAPAGPESTDPVPSIQDLTGAWFAPLPPMPTRPGREFIGSDDFMELFSPDARWSSAAGHLRVFKLYGEWVAYHATDDELREAVRAIRSRGLALAVEVGPLDATEECGSGVEGFAGTAEGERIAERIIAAGGRIDALALDEPYYHASVYDGPGACRWDAGKVASEVGEYVSLMRSFFPDVVVGDIEPTPAPATPSTYTGWLETFREVNGYDLGFLHLDIDWSRDGWAEDAAEVVAFGRRSGVPVGVIYTGNHADPSDDRWLARAAERVREYEAAAGAAPPHVIFQSWMDRPDAVLPEDDRWTFTGLVATYFEHSEELGFTPDQLADDLALGRPATASSTEGNMTAARAVDGDTGTRWAAGAFPPQWIEMVLDGPQDVSEVRLTPAQFPEGATTHRLLALVAGEWVELAMLTGVTRDGVPIAAAGPWQDVERVRVETLASPSWVSWYEIEVLGD